MKAQKPTETELRLEYVGQHLKVWRQQRGLSQREVAQKIGYATPQFISNWERGASLPPLDVLPLLVELYDVPPKTLVAMMTKYQEKMLDFHRDRLENLLL